MKSRKAGPVRICLMLCFLLGLMLGFGGCNLFDLIDEPGTGDGTEDNPYLITTLEDLQAMEDDLWAHYALLNDIDATPTADWNGGKGFAPVGNHDSPFRGSLDGRGFVINGLIVDRPTDSNAGLFGAFAGEARVENLIIKEVDITGHGWVGAVVGLMKEGTIKDIEAQGQVYSTGIFAGGIAGEIEKGTVENCRAAVAVSGEMSRLGGLIGRNLSGTIKNSHATGRVEGLGNSNKVGGFVGQNYYGEIENCTATGEVSGNFKVGGFVGRVYQESRIIDSSASGDVSASGDYAGGFGGLINAPISSSKASGNVEGAGDWVGGFAGFNGAEQSVIEYCYATGSVSGGNNVGGFSGHNRGTLNQVYARGPVNGEEQSGGLFGFNEGQVEASYYELGPAAPGVTVDDWGRTTEQMQAGFPDAVLDLNGEDCPEGDIIYAGWEEDTWNFGTDTDYPWLRWLD